MFLFPTLYSAVHIILAGQDIKVKYGNMEISSEKDDKKEKETLLERRGYDETDRLLRQTSNYYDSSFLYGSRK